MNTHLRLTSMLVCALTAAPALSSPEVTTQVLQAGTYTNGNVYVMLAATVNEPGCPLTAIEIPAASAAAKQVLAAAMFAMGTGKSVKVVTNACYLGIPSFNDAVRNGYFGVAN